MWTCWSIYSFKKLWENIPPRVNMCKCITGAVCVTHRERRGAGVPLAAGRQSPAAAGPAPLPPAAGWRGPYGRMGLGEEPARWLDKRPPAEPRQSPACEGWPWGVGVTQRCPGGLREGFAAGQRGVSSRLNTRLVAPCCGTRVSFRGGSCPVPSRPVPQTEERGPAGEAESTTTPASSRSGVHGQESRSLPEQGLHRGEVCSRGKSGGARACVWTCGGLPLPPAARVRAHAHARAHTRTHADERNQRPGLYFVLFSGL